MTQEDSTGKGGYLRAVKGGVNQFGAVAFSGVSAVSTVQFWSSEQTFQAKRGLFQSVSLETGLNQRAELNQPARV